jgi:PST family polysaccharide transporter
MSRLQGEHERLRSTYLTGAAVLGLVSAPLGALLVVLAPEFVGVILGPRWVPAIVPFQILTTGVMLRNVYLMAYCLDGAVGAMRQRTKRDGIYAFAVLTGSLIGTRFGLVGVATGVVLAIAVNYLVGAAMSLRMLGASWRDYARSQLPAFAIGLLTASVAYPVRIGLLTAGFSQVVVLTLTCLASLTVLGVLYLARPSIIGYYGSLAARHFAAAVSAKLNPNQAS